MLEMLESLWINLESSAENGKSHRILVTVSDIVFILESTSVNRIITIAETMAANTVC